LPGEAWVQFRIGFQFEKVFEVWRGVFGTGG